MTTNSILNSSQPLFALTRKSIPEVVVCGLAHVKHEGEEPQGSDPSARLIGRALLKPWQYLACGVNISDSFMSLGLASHSCQSVHWEHLKKLADFAKAGENELFCPRSYPLDELLMAKMKLDGVRPNRMQHPCSGKHLVMLAACQKYGFDTERYFEFDHPIQKKLQGIVGQLIDEKPDWVNDSCGLPTLAASVRAHMNMWERMALCEEEEFVSMKQLWVNNPTLVGGRDRLDTALIELGGGRLLVKEAADGLLMIQSLPESGIKTASIMIKVASGAKPSHLALALWSVISREAGLPPVFAEIAEYLRSKLENWVPGDQELVLPPFL